MQCTHPSLSLADFSRGKGERASAIVTGSAMASRARRGYTGQLAWKVLARLDLSRRRQRRGRRRCRRGGHGGGHSSRDAVGRGGGGGGGGGGSGHDLGDLPRGSDHSSILARGRGAESNLEGLGTLELPYSSVA